MDKINIPEPLPSDGFRIPLCAAFTGLKGLPLIALSKNSIAPLLMLYADGVKFRVFIQRKKGFADFERVDATRCS